MRRNLTRQERLRKGTEIKEMLASAKRIEARGLKLLYKVNGRPITRFAVVVTRGCGGAVKRNREKRISREAWRSLKETVIPGHDLVVMVYRFGASYAERCSTMSHLIGRAGLRSRAD